VSGAGSNSFASVPIVTGSPAVSSAASTMFLICRVSSIENERGVALDQDASAKAGPPVDCT
jgi:hypothetical protein